VTALLLCRHGQTDWNELGRYQGQTDVPLNAMGWDQARRLAALLAMEPLVAVFASDLSRAADTAREIARFHDLEVQADARLREINQGSWEGLTIEEIRRQDPDLLNWWERHPLQVTLPGGESIGDVQARALPLVDEIARSYPEGLVCVVSHKVVITVIRCALTGDPLEAALRHLPANASFERIELATG
jgi:broad specificity phosphatase PhoE